jgi:hypothetical protein
MKLTIPTFFLFLVVLLTSLAVALPSSSNAGLYLSPFPSARKHLPRTIDSVNSLAAPKPKLGKNCIGFSGCTKCSLDKFSALQGYINSISTFISLFFTLP